VPHLVSYDTSVRNVTCVSDVEGQWDYFSNFVEHSKGLSFAVPAEPSLRRDPDLLELELEDGWHFVYGGDACDKGSGTLRFLEAMVTLKKKSPNRVHLLFGNGDINRLRWADELRQSDLTQPKEVTGPLWAAAGPFQFEPEDFETRREELAHMEGKFTHEVTDKDVMKSYLEGLKQGGWLHEYLHLAQMGVMLGETLFVDGQVIALSPEEVGTVTAEEKEKAGLEMEDWVTRLNSWARNRLEEMDQKPPWEKLPDQVPKRKQQPAGEGEG